MIEISDQDGVVMARCLCRAESSIIAASEVDLAADRVRANLLDLVDHARRCPAAARLPHLLAERYPKVP